MTSNLCVSVGVSKYTPGLSRLPGAVIAARDFSTWASTTGYKSILISDDQGKAVTAARLREALEAALTENQIERLIFFFAGHGTAVGAANECWLLTNILKDPDEAIDRVAFYRQLQTYRIHQIAFFADACRTVSQLSLDVNGRSILCHGGADRLNPEFDIFLASSLGHPALMIKGVSDSKSRCLFTDVVLDGLYGKAEGAIEQRHHVHAPAVLSHTLANFVETEAKNRASLLNRISEPEIQAAFRAPNDVYLKLHQAGLNAYTPPPDHPRERPYVPAPRGTEHENIELEGRRRRSDNQIARVALDRVTPNFLRRVDAERHKYRPDQLSRFARETVNLSRLLNLTGVIWSGSVSRCALPQSMTFESMSAKNLATSPINGLAFSPDHQSHFLIFTEAKNGNLSSVPVFQRLVAVVTQAKSEVRAINYIGRETWEGNISDDYSKILGPLSSGQLKSSDANGIADRIREYKHENPVLGVVAGYLYAATGDFDNIIRTGQLLLRGGTAGSV